MYFLIGLAGLAAVAALQKGTISPATSAAPPTPPGGSSGGVIQIVAHNHHVNTSRSPERAGAAHMLGGNFEVDEGPRFLYMGNRKEKKVVKVGQQGQGGTHAPVSFGGAGSSTASRATLTSGRTGLKGSLPLQPPSQL